MEAHNPSPTADAPSPDAAFRLLSDRRRRYAVAVLADRAAPVSLDHLAGLVAAWETDSDEGAAPARRTEAVAAALHHSHLPKLADAGVVAYDADEKVVAPARTDPLEPLVATAADVPAPSE